MQVQHDLLDIIRRTAVVIDDDDPPDGLQQGLALDLIRPVGIHHDEQALGIRRQQSLLPRDKAVVVFRQGPQQLQKLAGHIGAGIEDNIGFFSLFPAHAADARCRADRIQIRHFMPHDKDPAGLDNQLGQG